MTTSSNHTPTPALAGSPPMPIALLESLAARYRQGGLCLLMFNRDGRLLWQDPGATPFFQRYVAPSIASSEREPDCLVNLIAAMSSNSALAVWDVIPGIVISGFPYVERRQMYGVLALAGKDSSFRLSPDIVRLCDGFGIDKMWLNQQADEQPGYSNEAIRQQARLLLGSVQDQQRLAGLESKLSSMSGQLTNTYEELSLIYQISSGMKVSRRPADFFRQTCLDSIDVVGANAMGVALPFDDSLCQIPVLYGSLSLSPEKIKRLSTELVAWMARRKSSLLSNDLRLDKNFAWLADDAKRLLAVPLQRGELVLGCMYVLDKEHGDFDSVDIKLLNSIANESAIYLENATLFEDVHGLMMGLLHSLTSAVDAKDAYTCGHSERVALLGKALAQEYGLNEQQVERIYMAGLLHDVGKIGVPESVLGKPGKLTAEEFEQMKRHPAIGAKILQDVKQIEDIIPGVLHHHERFDGRGYPGGLSGQNIPLMGRIICLADCFDAMTSTRTYRKAMPLEVTLADIRRCSGTQFDPGLTEAFLRISPDRLRDIVRQQDARSVDAERNGIVFSVPAESTLQNGKAA